MASVVASVSVTLVVVAGLLIGPSRVNPVSTDTDLRNAVSALGGTWDLSQSVRREQWNALAGSEVCGYQWDTVVGPVRESSGHTFVNDQDATVTIHTVVAESFADAIQYQKYAYASCRASSEIVDIFNPSLSSAGIALDDRSRIGIAGVDGASFSIVEFEGSCAETTCAAESATLEEVYVEAVTTGFSSS